MSPSTVSRALKGDTRISQGRRTTILATAQDLGYFPNASARSLATRRSGLIGFMNGPITNPYFSELLSALVAKTSARDQQLMILHMGREAPPPKSIEALLSYQMDGCIISSASLSSQAAEICHGNGLPLVMINRVPRVQSSAVSCNNFEGSRILIRLLVETGHRRIALVGGTPNASTSTDRCAGVLSGLSAADLSLFARKDGLATYDTGFSSTMELMQQTERPDAIFAINDITAIGAIDAIRSLGYSVPNDVSVTGFDNIKEAERAQYALTTIAQPTGVMVDRALDIMEARIREPDAAGEHIYLEGELIIRGSVALGDRFDQAAFRMLF